jgi:UDPglucose 6-dehydrogenase
LLVRKAVEFFGEDLTGKRFAIWGLSFKPKTDDMREAPALTIIAALKSRGATVAAHDPEAMKEAKRILGDGVDLCATPEDALKGADALLVCTEWSVYRQPDYARIKSLLKTPTIMDGRNIYDPVRMRDLGFRYYGVGRKATSEG